MCSSTGIKKIAVNNCGDDRDLQLWGTFINRKPRLYNKECYVYTYFLSIYNKPISHDIRYTVNIWQLGINYFFSYSSSVLRFFWQESHLVSLTIRQFRTCSSLTDPPCNVILSKPKARSRSRPRGLPCRDAPRATGWSPSRGSLSL